MRLTFQAIVKGKFFNFPTDLEGISDIRSRLSYQRDAPVAGGSNTGAPVNNAIDEAGINTPHSPSRPSPMQEAGGFFQHHGVSAPGVRIFRKLQFSTKAMIVSVMFLLPILLLAASLLTSTQETIDFAVKERAGVAAMRALVPVYAGVLKVRFQTRAIFGGYDASADRRLAWDETAKAVAALKQTLTDSGDPLGFGPDVNKLDATWQATAESLNAKDGKGLSVFAPVTKNLATLLSRIGDDSNLVLDPAVDSFYLVNALILAMPAAAEDLARVWGWSTYASAKSGLEPKESKNLVVWSVNATSRLNDAHSHFDRAAAANPALTAKLALSPIDSAINYVTQASMTIDAGSWDADGLYSKGLATTTELFKVYATGLSALDELLAARVAAAQQARNVRFALVAASLLMAGYLFHSFYLVTRGGLSEVKRHLVAMTAGDLTTSPNPWGKDEAAALMLSLHDMQASLRNIVGQVRSSSTSIVHASTEIAAASMDLSARTEQTAANLEESASSMEEISSTVKHTAVNVREAAQVASGNSESAARGGIVIQHAVTTMQEINASSKKISDIIGTIDSIAFQTNILALNAAVEAARAGEQGRGFAVVASEVRSLAQRSSRAAKEIKTLISASVEKVETGTKVVRGAVETMQELVSNARRMNDLLTEVSNAALEQSNGVSQVGSAVSELDRMTQQNAALVEQTAAASSSLKDQALGLAREVDRFKLPIGAADGWYSAADRENSR